MRFDKPPNNVGPREGAKGSELSVDTSALMIKSATASGRLDYEMQMIAHQTVSVDLPTDAPAGITNAALGLSLVSPGLFRGEHHLVSCTGRVTQHVGRGWA